MPLHEAVHSTGLGSHVPGHSQILSCSLGKIGMQEKTWVWPGKEIRFSLVTCVGLLKRHGNCMSTLQVDTHLHGTPVYTATLIQLQLPAPILIADKNCK